MLDALDAPQMLPCMEYGYLKLPTYDLYVSRSTPSKEIQKGFFPIQNKGHLGSRYIPVNVWYMLMSIFHMGAQRAQKFALPDFRFTQKELRVVSNMEIKID